MLYKLNNIYYLFGFYIFDQTSLDFYKYNFVSENNHTSIIVLNFHSAWVSGVRNNAIRQYQ